MDAPDLQSILQNLARYANPSQPLNTTQSTVNADSLPLPTRSGSVSSLRVAETPEDPKPRPQSRSSATASPKPVIDPATITTWQDGIRCVTKIAAQNAQFASSIRKMIEDQRKHELRWYSERQALKHTQAKRASSAAQAQSILLSLPVTPTSNESASRDGVDNEAELAEFDRKIYDAQQKLEGTMIAELKGLGVPFFGTDQSLVMVGPFDDSTGLAVGDRPKWSPTVTETELLELRRRMVRHLEDLYKD